MVRVQSWSTRVLHDLPVLIFPVGREEDRVDIDLTVQIGWRDGGAALLSRGTAD